MSVVSITEQTTVILFYYQLFSFKFPFHYLHQIIKSHLAHKHKGTYLLLHSSEVLNLDDEWSSSTLVLNSSNKSPNMVHTDGLWPTPIAPTFNTDV